MFLLAMCPSGPLAEALGSPKLCGSWALSSCLPATFSLPGPPLREPLHSWPSTGLYKHSVTVQSAQGLQSLQTTQTRGAQVTAMS